jgi:hypothetical protein
MFKKILIVGQGQDGSILKELCKINNQDYYTISKEQIYKNEIKISNIKFCAETIADFICDNSIDTVFYTSALQIGNSIIDLEEESKFYDINSNIPFNILRKISKSSYKNLFNFYYFSSCYLFKPNEGISLDSEKILNDFYKKSKNDFLLKVKNFELSDNISVKNIYLFPHDSPLKEKSFLNNLITSIKKEKKVNIALSNNRPNLFIDCAFELMKAIFVDSQNTKFSNGVHEYLLGGLNSFNLYDFIKFLEKKYHNNSDINLHVNFSDIEIDYYHCIKNNMYKSNLYYEKILSKVFWERMILEKKSYKNAIQNNFFKT